MSAANPFAPKPREFQMPRLLGPYTLHPDAAEALRKSADPACRRCQGTGVPGWKRRGHRALVCKCADAKWRMLTGQSALVAPEVAPLVTVAQPNPAAKEPTAFVLGPNGEVAVR